MKTLLLAVAFAADVICFAHGDDASQSQRLPAWRNERVNARYSIRCDQSTPALKFAVSDFVGTNGRKIPSACAKARIDDEILAGNRPADGSCSVWFSVDVPRETAPDSYTGTLTVTDARGGVRRCSLVLDVRHEVLPDSKDWKFFRELGRPDRNVKPGSGDHGSLQELIVRAGGPLLKDDGDRKSMKWERLRDGIETYEKVRVLTDSNHATWHLLVALKCIDAQALTNAQASACANCLKTVDEAVDELSTPAKVNGRVIERFDEVYGAECGYKEPVNEVYLVQHPTPANDRAGRPLYVVLHSSGHNCVNALLCTRAPNNHDIYHAPDDFYALYLDCKMAAGTDWWWGYNSCHGFELSPCERRCLATIEKVVSAYGIDRDRIYLCGNSMGGSGCLGFALRHGDVFAAAKANVPALVEHACDRMGWDMKTERDAAGVDFARLPDPPLLIDHSAPNDMHWSTGHEHLFAMMNARRYPWISYWADHKHCNRNCLILEKNDIYLTFDWTNIRKCDILPAFTHTATDTPYPWPDHRDAPGAGQINAFFQWRDGRDTENEVSITLVVADLKSKHFNIPASVQSEVTLRRLRTLKVRPGDVFDWTFGPAHGQITVGRDGLLTVPGLTITKTPQTLRLVRR